MIEFKKGLFLSIVLLQKNVFRGFHFQTKNKQAKYVNVIKGNFRLCYRFKKI